MKKIFVCSPYRNSNPVKFAKNLKLAKSYCKKIVELGYMPLAPHLYFTHIYNDDDDNERRFGIYMGMKWLEECDEVHVLGNYVSEGMEQEIMTAKQYNKKIVYVKEPLK